MRRLTLPPIEEICFRVMMQLCGAYHQPQFAMNVLNEMNLMGMTPNAVTYGMNFYFFRIEFECQIEFRIRIVFRIKFRIEFRIRIVFRISNRITKRLILFF